MVLERKDLEEAARLFKEYSGNYVRIAAALGLARSSAQHRVKQAAKQGLLGLKPVPPGFDIRQITSGPNGESVKMQPTGPEVVKPDGLILRGSSILSRDGEEVIRWDKYGEERDLSNAALVEAVRGAFADYEAPSLRAQPETCRDDAVTVYPLADFHVGLLAWENETGQNYDTHIARETIVAAMMDLIASTYPSRRAVVLGLGDLLHFDGYEPRTERSGNVLDTDSRYPKVLKTALQIVKVIISLALERHETVEVRLLPGNHDDRAALAVSLALSEAYEDHPRVTVDDSPSRFWFRRYDRVFLGATHGEKAKMAAMPLIMACDRPEDWAASTRRRIYTGHIHHEKVQEHPGAIVESLRSPVRPDAYHTFAGYRSGRSVYSQTFRLDGSRMFTSTFDL